MLTGSFLILADEATAHAIIDPATQPVVTDAMVLAAQDDIAAEHNPVAAAALQSALEGES